MNVCQYESEKSLADFLKQLQNRTILVYVKMYNRLFPCNQVDGPENGLCNLCHLVGLILTCGPCALSDVMTAVSDLYEHSPRGAGLATPLLKSDSY